MADLFDQKSLRIPPMMGKAARTKLNKSGSYRMPPNLKGVHSAAQGGLGGAYTKGKKLRGFSGEDGSFVDPEGENGTPMTGLFGVGGQQIKPLEANFSSGLGDDEPESNGIPDDSPEAAGAALSGVGPKSPKDMNPDDIPASMDLGSKRIQEELSKYMPYARQQLEGMQNPREGGLNLPMLQFAAGLMSPTRTGSFGESIGTGMNMGLNALANQRKQDLDYQTLKAKLGLDIEKTPLEVAMKLGEMEANQDYKNAYLKILEGKNGNKVAQKANEYAEKANVELGKQYQKSADASRELGEGLTQLEQILPDLPESPATDWITSIDVFNALPMTKAKNEADKIIKQTIIPKVKNLGVNPSNRDLIFTQDAFVKSGSTPRANQRALLAGKMFADRVKEMNDIYNDMYSSDYYAENPRQLKRDFNKRIDELPSIAEAVDAKLPPEKPSRHSSVSKAEMNQVPTSSNVINFDDLPE